MLPLDPRLILKEIRDAERLRKTHLETWTEIVQRFATRSYRRDSVNEGTPENYAFSYSKTMLPQLVASPPAVEVEAVTTMQDDPVAEGLGIAIDYWQRETGWEGQLKACVQDCLLSWGIMKMGMDWRGDYSGSGGLEGVQGDFEMTSAMPYGRKVSVQNFFIDARCTAGTNARLMGEEFWRDLDDVQNDERYDQEARATLHEDNEDDRPRDGEAFERTKHDGERKRVKLYEVYLPEHRRIVVIADQGEAAVMLLNEKYYGPDEGPYVVFGLYIVPDQVYPISPIVACWEQMIEVEEHSVALAEEAKTHKRIGVYSAGAKADSERIQKAAAGDMVGVNDPNSVKDFEIGGASPARAEYVTALRDRVDRNLGMTDAQRGMTNTKTATVNQIAQANIDKATQWMQGQVERFASDCIRRVLWYFMNESSVRMRMVQLDEATGIRSDVEFRGGPWEGGFVDTEQGAQWIEPNRPDMDVTDFRLTVKTGSMAMEEDALRQKRAQDEWLLMQGMAALVNQTLAMAYGPQVVWQVLNWRRALDRYGRAFGEHQYSKTVFNEQVLSQLVQGMSPGGAMAQQFGPDLQTNSLPTAQSPVGMVGTATMAQPGQMPMRPPMAPGLGMSGAMRSPASMPGLMANAAA